MERMKICSELWKAGIKAELLPRANPKIQQQLNYADSQLIPFSIIFGQQELEKGELKVKNLKTGEQEAFPRENMIAFLSKKIEDFYANPQ